MKLNKSIHFFLLIFATILKAQIAGDAVPGQFLVQFNTQEVSEQLTEELKQSGMQRMELISAPMNIWLLHYSPNRTNVPGVTRALKANPAIVHAQLNRFVTRRMAAPIIPNDPLFNTQWNLNNTGQNSGKVDADIDAPEAWEFGFKPTTALGDTIVVAVVDGGADLNHPDIRYWRNKNEIAGNGIDDDGNGYIDDINGWDAYGNDGTIPTDAHGTHVAGIVGAKTNNGLGVAGVAPGVQIMTVAGSSSVESEVIRAYSYVLTMRKLYNETGGAKGAYVVSTNASFGVDYGKPQDYPLWGAMYDSLGAYGIISACATANLGINVDIRGDIPSTFTSEYIISVTNSTSTDVINSSAGFGSTHIDLAAPGTQINSTVQNSGYQYLTGTSMATPHVAGAVAFLYMVADSSLLAALRSNPALLAREMRSFLLQGVDSLDAYRTTTATGGRLNLYKAALQLFGVKDSVPPTVITSIQLGTIGSDFATITWTAPKDSSRLGVVAYDVRVSNSPILNIADFLAAQKVVNAPTPSAPGTKESFTLYSLLASKTYYVAIRSNDNNSNFSPISPAQTFTTLGEPTYSVNKKLGLAILTPGSVAKDSIVFYNNSISPSTLRYSISVLESNFPSKALIISSPEIKTEKVKVAADRPQESEISEGSILRGGSDEFGYKWSDSDEKLFSPYYFASIKDIGTEIKQWNAITSVEANDEGVSNELSMKMSFPFYDSTYNTLRISPNGFVSFTPVTVNTYFNTKLPGAGQPNATIAPMWSDFVVRENTKVLFYSTPDSTVVQYDSIVRFNSLGVFHFQVILYPSGVIRFNYDKMVGTLSGGTVGIENHKGTMGLTIAVNQTYLKPNHSIVIRTIPEWYQLPTVISVINQSSQAVLPITFRSEKYALGTYTAKLLVTTNDPKTPLDTLAIKMDIQRIVPVELTNFSAVADNKSVLLVWNTASEINNKGFEVERRMEFEKQYSSIGFIKGAGTSSEGNNYQFNDTTEYYGKATYRLRQTDYDGTFSYSNEISVESGRVLQFGLQQNYPNPFNPTTVISFSLPIKTLISLKVFDTIGREVAVLASGAYEPGVYSLPFSGEGLASGIYICRLEAAENTFTKKMTLIK